MAETPMQRFRAPKKLWDAFVAVSASRGTTASAELIDFMRRTVKRHGDQQQLADLAEAEADLARPRPGPQRRKFVDPAAAHARQQGRPPRTPPPTE